MLIFITVVDIDLYCEGSLLLSPVLEYMAFLLQKIEGLLLYKWNIMNEIYIKFETRLSYAFS